MEQATSNGYLQGKGRGKDDKDDISKSKSRSISSRSSRSSMSSYSSWSGSSSRTSSSSSSGSVSNSSKRSGYGHRNYSRVRGSTRSSSSGSSSYRGGSRRSISCRENRSFSPRERDTRRVYNTNKNDSKHRKSSLRSRSRSSSRPHPRRRIPHDTERVVATMPSNNRNDYTYQRDGKLSGAVGLPPPALPFLINDRGIMMRDTSGAVLDTPARVADPSSRVDMGPAALPSQQGTPRDLGITSVTQSPTQTSQLNKANLILSKRRERILQATAHHDKHRSKQSPMNHTILHRACIQFSSPLVFQHNSSAILGQSTKQPDLHDEINAKLYADIKKSICFIKCHLIYYPRELARALLWRVVEADGEEDRIGAWMLLDAGIRATNAVSPVVILHANERTDKQLLTTTVTNDEHHHHDGLTSHNLKKLERTGSVGTPQQELQRNKGQQIHHPLDEAIAQFRKDLFHDTNIVSRATTAAEEFLRHITQFMSYLVLFCWGSRDEVTKEVSQQKPGRALSLQHRMHQFIEGPLTKYSVKGGVNDLRINVRGHGLLKEVTDLRNAMKNSKGFNSSMLAAMPLSATHHTIERVSDEIQLIAMEAIQCSYRRILRGWKFLFSNEFYRRIYRAVEDHFVALRETPQSASTSVVTEEHKATFARFLLPTERMSDSLSKLRRQEPRPRLVFTLLEVFGYPVWPKEAIGATAPFSDNEGKAAIAHEESIFLWNVPSSMNEVYHECHDGTLGEDSLNARAQRWLKKAIDHKGGCVACDRWDHISKECPNRPSRQMVLDTSADAMERAKKTIETHVDAGLTVFDIEIGRVQLSGVITEPSNSEERRQNLVATVLEVVFENLCKGVPVSGILDALDIIQGHNSTGIERQALALLSSYSLSPLKVLHIFPEKTQSMNAKSGSCNEFCTTSGANALEYLRGERRYVEAEGLAGAFEVLHHRFCPPSSLQYILSHQAQQDLRLVKQQGSYFFCLFKAGGRSIRAGLFSGNKPLLEACERLGRIQHLVDPATLTLRSISGPIFIGSSPQYEDPSLANYDTSLKWDWHIAKRVLVRYGLIGPSASQRESLGAKYAHEELLNGISQKAFDEKKYGRESDFYALKIAERLVRKHHYCQFCHCIGHSKRFCVSLLKLMLQRNEWGVGVTLETARLCKGRLETLLQLIKAEVDANELKVKEANEKKQSLNRQILDEEGRLEVAKKDVDILMSKNDVSDEELLQQRRVIEDRIDDHRRQLGHMDDSLRSIIREKEMLEGISRDKRRSARSIEDAITIIHGDRRGAGDQGPGAGGFYPTNFAKAIEGLEETGLSLSEARYCSEDCHTLLIATNSLRYANEIPVFASSKFPEISPFSNRFLADYADEMRNAIRQAISTGNYDRASKVKSYRLEAQYQHTPNAIIAQQLCDDRVHDMAQYLKRVFYGATLHSLALPRTEDSANIRNTLIQIGEEKISEVSLIINSSATNLQGIAPLDAELQFFMGLLGDDRAAYTFAAAINYIKGMKMELKSLRERKALRPKSKTQSCSLFNTRLSRVRPSVGDTDSMVSPSQQYLGNSYMLKDQSQTTDFPSPGGPYDRYTAKGTSISGVKRQRDSFDYNGSSHDMLEACRDSGVLPSSHSDTNDRQGSMTPRPSSYSMPSGLSQDLMTKGYYSSGPRRGGSIYMGSDGALQQTQLGGFQSQISSDGDAGQVAGSYQVSPQEAANC